LWIEDFIIVLYGLDLSFILVKSLR